MTLTAESFSRRGFVSLVVFVQERQHMQKTVKDWLVQFAGYAEGKETASREATSEDSSRGSPSRS